MNTNNMRYTTKKNEEQKFEEQKFEFVLYINNHIICQRYFNIRDYDENVVNLNMKTLMDTITGMRNGEFSELGIIPNFLKTKTIDYLWNNYNPFYFQNEEESKNIYDRVDNFQFEIKIDKISVGKSEFSGNIFPPKVRYAVDIKEIIPSIISEIRDAFSQEIYELV